MDKQKVLLENAKELSIKAMGDLELMGWDQSEINIGSNDAKTDRHQETISLICNDDCMVQVPRGLKIIVEKVSGDASIKNFTGTLIIQRVGGDLHLGQVASPVIERVGGDAELMSIAGPVVIHHIGGGITGADLTGPVRFDTVGGDLEINGLGEGFSGMAGGDVEIRMLDTISQSSRLRAGGNILCLVPKTANLNMSIKSGGRDIKLNTSAVQQEIEKKFHQVTLGSGNVEISLMAGGNVEVTDSAWEDVVRGEYSSGNLHDLDARISQKVERKLHKLDRLSEDITRSTMDSINARLGSRGIEVTVDGTTYGGSEASDSFAEHSPNPVVVDEPVSEDERLMVLKMVQEKKISVEQAEKLLEALDAQESQA